MGKKLVELPSRRSKASKICFSRVLSTSFASQEEKLPAHSTAAVPVTTIGPVTTVPIITAVITMTLVRSRMYMAGFGGEGLE